MLNKGILLHLINLQIMILELWIVNCYTDPNCICFRAVENSEFPLTIQKGADTYI